MTIKRFTTRHGFWQQDVIKNCMKSTTLLFLIFFCSLSCYSQNEFITAYTPLSDSLNKILRSSDEYLGVFYSEGGVCPDKNVDGEYVCFGNSGVIIRGTVKNRMLNGAYTTYYDDGKTYYKGTMVNDKLQGLVTFYYKNGNIKSVCEFKNGKLWNLNELYNVKGNKLNKGNFSNGTGKLNLYYSNGKLFRSSTMKDGETDGITEYYYLNGAIMIKGTFVKNKTMGKWTEFSIDGKMLFEKNFR